MGFEEDINMVNKEIDEAIRLIKTNQAGANLELARKFLTEAGKAIENDAFEGAIAFAKKAQLAAMPTTEYIILKAKELSENAKKSFESKSYENAISMWNKALEKYAEAEGFAQKRDEKEHIMSVLGAKKIIQENISSAGIAIDKQEMFDLIASGEKAADRSKSLLETKKFEQAMNAYELVKETIKDALMMAEKRNFEEKVKIKEALIAIEAKIKACSEAIDKQKIPGLIESGEKAVEEAKRLFEDKQFNKASNAYEEAKKSFKNALELAEKRNFAEKVKIKEALKNIELGIEAIRKSELESKLMGDVKAIEPLHKNIVKRINEGLQLAEEKGRGKELFYEFDVQELKAQIGNIKALIKEEKFEDASKNIIMLSSRLKNIEPKINDFVDSIEKYDFWSKKVKGFVEAKGFVVPEDIEVPEVGRKWVMERFYHENPEVPVKFDGDKLVKVGFKVSIPPKPIVPKAPVETCNICLGTIKQEASIKRCRACKRVYHQACADRVGGLCPTCGQELS